MTNAISMAIAVLAVSVIGTASGQITTACTNSLISSFTPCLNFITGSTNGGGSPTADCCKALGSLISSGTDCTCLILTGNVPFSLPINRTLAISLPRMCKSTSVPLQCKATATPLPSPGPVTYGPALPPLPPIPGTGSDSVPPALSPSLIEPASPPAAIAESPVNQGLNQGQRPLVLPSSAARLSPSVLLLLALGTMLLNKI